MNHFSKAEFVDTIFDRIPSNASNDFAEKVILDFLRYHVPSGKLYKYRSITEHSLSNLKNGTLYCAKPSSFNDPFDCQIGLDISRGETDLRGWKLLTTFLTTLNPKIWLKY